MQLKSLFKILAVSAGLAVVPTLASAQAYPTQAIKIIVPAPPGGAIDTIARVVGDKLQASMGQPVIIDNRPGASNNLGTDLLAKSAPDGYTIGIVGGSHNINKFLFKNLGWDPETSFEPIVYTHEVPLVFAIYPQIPAKTLPEFMAWMKANPDEAKVATSGRGSAQEMAAEMFRMASGMEMLLVPYKGSSAAHPDLLGGRIALYIDTISAIQSQVKAGNVRAVAVSTRKRTRRCRMCRRQMNRGSRATTPTPMAASWRLPARPRRSSPSSMPRSTRRLKMPDVRAKLEAAGIEIQGGTPQEYAALIKSDLAKWGKVVKEAGIPAE